MKLQNNTTPVELDSPCVSEPAVALPSGPPALTAEEQRAVAFAHARTLGRLEEALDALRLIAYEARHRVFADPEAILRRIHDIASLQLVGLDSGAAENSNRPLRSQPTDAAVKQEKARS